ncbi:MAG: DUF5916 domain-containing protein, partial [Flavobacteriales bacterium]
MLKFVFSILLLALAISAACSQEVEKKKLSAEFIESSILIDGILEEEAWNKAEIASDFVQNRPNPGQNASFKSEIKVLYSNEFIYVGAEMHDASPDSILHQLTERDNIDNSDLFGLWISSFRDGINAFEFMVTPDGVQLDALVSTDGEDFNWNAVWQCNTRIHDKGWTAEFKIPYSAFRFAEADEQVWDINFFRTIRRYREQSFWQHVDPAQAGFIQQSGELNNIKDISPPVRLFFYPYASGYYETAEVSDGPRRESTSLNGGMDIKFGINESFTLDMTLIPDFGQVQSDNQVLNLSPFEVRFNENRQFFTEGTELFSKGDLFYSRRIGEYPINGSLAFENLAENEEVKSFPGQTQLLNATKISGRNSNGLGIGFLNAVVDKAEAVVENDSGDKRTVEVAPLTNYNIFVLDQNLKNNSYASITNTNVLRNGHTYDANVTAFTTALRNKENSIELFASAAYNKKFNFDDEDSDDGYTYFMVLSKINGNWNYGAGHSVESDSYDPNDFGFLFAPNEINYSAFVNYTRYEPFGKFNGMRTGFETNYNRLHTPNAFTSFSMDAYLNMTTKGFHTFGIDASLVPTEAFDYFEARKDGAFVVFPKQVSASAFISSDYRRKIALDLRYWTDINAIPGWFSSNYRIAPRVRMSDKVMLTYVYSFQHDFNQQGFAGFDSDDNVIIGKRDVTVHTNVLNLRYIFTNRMGLTFRARHYWSNASYNSYARLAEEGNLFDAQGAGYLSSSFNSYETLDGNGELATVQINDDGVASNNRSFNAFNI